MTVTLMFFLQHVINRQSASSLTLSHAHKTPLKAKLIKFNFFFFLQNLGIRSFVCVTHEAQCVCLETWWCCWCDSFLSLFYFSNLFREYKVFFFKTSASSEPVMLTPNVAEHLRMSLKASKCHWRSLKVSEHLRTSQNISVHLRTSLNISEHLWTSENIS